MYPLRLQFVTGTTERTGAAMVATQSIADTVAELAKSFTGQLLLPVDPDYDQARRVHNGLIDRRPALVARCRGASRRC